MAEQKLTPKQEAFALEYIMNGKIAVDAYKKVYDTKTDNTNTLYVNAHKVLKVDKVSLRIHQLEMNEYSAHILSIEERKQLLTKWSKEGDLKAVDLLNKMESVYVDKSEVRTQLEVNYYAPEKNGDN